MAIPKQSITDFRAYVDWNISAEDQKSFNKDNIRLTTQEPKAVKYEIGFKDHYPVENIQIEKNKNKLFEDIREFEFEFEGIGFALQGRSVINSDNCWCSFLALS